MSPKLRNTAQSRVNPLQNGPEQDGTDVETQHGTPFGAAPISHFLSEQSTKPMVIRQRTEDQLWRTVALGFPGIFSPSPVRAVEAKPVETEHLEERKPSENKDNSLAGRLESRQTLRSGFASFLGRLTLGDGTDLDKPVPSERNEIGELELYFLSDCDVASCHYWQICLKIPVNREHAVVGNATATISNALGIAIEEGELVLPGGVQGEVILKREVHSGTMAFTREELPEFHSRAVSFRFPDGAEQAGRLVLIGSPKN